MTTSAGPTELNEARQKFAEIAQSQRNWCIAASIEVALHYFGVKSVTQADLMKEFCRTHGAESLLRAPGESHANFSVDQIFELSKTRNPNTGFGGLVEVLQGKIDLTAAGIAVEQKTDATDLMGTLKAAVTRGACFLMPCQNRDGSFHVYPVVGFDGDLVSVYEPWTRRFLKDTSSGLGANGDWLIFRRTVKD
jgi:hypothetical protein